MENQRLKLPLDDNIVFNLADLDDLLETLLGENGCPWDKEQTFETLKKYLIEECYEAAEAIDNNDMENMCEEIGDVLFQLMFISKLASYNSSFTMENVIDGVCRKMVSRHTHIFADEKVTDAESVEVIWENNKKKEKKHKTLYNKLQAVPAGMPALMKAEKIMAKTMDKDISKDENIDAIIDQLNKMKGSAEIANMENIGNLLLAVSVFSTQMQINAEFALTNALKTYINKFENIENY